MDASLKSAAQSLGITYFDNIPDDYFSKQLIEKLPVAWARQQILLPISTGGKDFVLISNPDNIDLEHKASLIVGKSLEMALAEPEIILDAIGRCYAAFAAASNQASTPKQEDENDSERGFTQKSQNDLLVQDDSAPVTRLVNSILLEAVRENVSDIHFEPFPEKTIVRFRIDGVLCERATPPKSMEAALVSRLKVMAGMDIAERRIPQDGMAQVKVGQKSIDIRVSTVPVADGERLVLRLLNRDNACLPMRSLGMSGTILASMRSLMRSPNGIIIVSGPTGSGKTTTLYAALGELDSARRNILTIEDPVEYRLPNIGQIQVKPKIGLTFASGLRHILRQDPDVVLVGETRDPETAEIAVRASLTGHLVFTTLHTNDAPSAIMRLTDMGIPPYLLASSLRGVLAQRLVRTLCPYCKETVKFDADAIPSSLRTHEIISRLSVSGLPKAVGCDKCNGGYKGRKGIFELMTCTPEISAMIRAGIQDGADLNKAATDGGMLPMLDDALQKVVPGVTDIPEISSVLAL